MLILRVQMVLEMLAYLYPMYCTKDIRKNKSSPELKKKNKKKKGASIFLIPGALMTFESFGLF